MAHRNSKTLLGLKTFLVFILVHSCSPFAVEYDDLQIEEQFNTQIHSQVQIQNVENEEIYLVTNDTTTGSPVTTAQPHPVWPLWKGSNFPNPRSSSSRQLCRSTNQGEGQVCIPDDDPTSINEAHARSLDRTITTLLEKNKCACGRNCYSSFPKGKYSMSIAVAHSIGEPIAIFGTNLRQKGWSNLARCDDNLVIVLVTGTRQVFTATSREVRKQLPNSCISEILEKTKHLFANGSYFEGLNETLYYYSNALQGGSCGTRTGLSVGQIVGIVVGVLAGVASIITMIVFCVGFFQNWEFVVGTCAGVCIGAILGAFQSCINAIIFSCWMSILEELGCADCGDCCECEPFECISDDGGYQADDGGGGDGGDF